MRGPAPSENKRRRNADTFSPLQTLTDDGERSGEPLGGVWPQYVLDWWDTWRRSPQAKVFTGTDWMRLRMVAALVAQYFECPEKGILAEIRQNESLLGATHTDRLRARIKVTPAAAETESPAGVTAIDEYRRALSS